MVRAYVMLFVQITFISEVVKHGYRQKKGSFEQF